MLPVISNTELSMPSFGDDAQALDLFNAAFNGFSAAFRFLRPRKMDFAINSGGTVTTLGADDVVGVLLGVAPYDHCTWYEKKFTPGQEPERPDLLWIRYTPTTFPEALPAQYRRKVNVGGTERWDFRIARRTVWALLTRDANGQAMLDIDNPVILDMTSASMFGRSDERSGLYKWAGLKNFCARWSAGGRYCNPSMFWMKICLDQFSSVSGVVVFKPALGDNGQPAWLDNATYAHVVEAARSQSVAEMLAITEILHRGDRDAAPEAPAAPAAPVAPAAPAAPVTPVPPVQAATETREETVTNSLLHSAQTIIENRVQQEAAAQATAEPAPAEPAQPAEPAEDAPETKKASVPDPVGMSDAGRIGLNSLMTSLHF